MKDKRLDYVKDMVSKISNNLYPKYDNDEIILKIKVLPNHPITVGAYIINSRCPKTNMENDHILNFTMSDISHFGCDRIVNIIMLAYKRHRQITNNPNK